MRTPRRPRGAGVWHDEKEQLADRVDALERGARAAAGAAKGQARRPRRRPVRREKRRPI